jgi:hypothetical protein
VDQEGEAASAEDKEKAKKNQEEYTAVLKGEK